MLTAASAKRSSLWRRRAKSMWCWKWSRRSVRGPRRNLRQMRRRSRRMSPQYCPEWWFGKRSPRRRSRQRLLYRRRRMRGLQRQSRRPLAHWVLRRPTAILRRTTRTCWNPCRGHCISKSSPASCPAPWTPWRALARQAYRRVCPHRHAGSAVSRAWSSSSIPPTWAGTASSAGRTTMEHHLHVAMCRRSCPWRSWSFGWRTD
mmetsp:Transcript_54695/g.119896  ORF Transcript_54695/g.119896 Transcript_54695/m.119896 type:complete len:203 (+) Transcript_54695:88-696(+)